MSEKRLWFVDMRFLVRAKDGTEASEKLHKFLPDTNDTVVEYAQISYAKLSKNEQTKRR